MCIDFMLAFAPLSLHLHLYACICTYVVSVFGIISRASMHDLQYATLCEGFVYVYLYMYLCICLCVVVFV